MQNNQGQQQLNMQQIMNNSTELKCENCGSMFFRNVNLLRKISPLVTSNGQPAVMPIPVWRCDDCDMPLDQLDKKDRGGDDPSNNESGDNDSGLKIVKP